MFKFVPEPKAGVIDATRAVGKHTLMLRARNIFLDREGYTRGLVAMFVGNVPIQSTKLDIDDEEDRHRFATGLYGTLTKNGHGRKPKLGTDIVSEFPIEDFEQEFMSWSRTVWSASIGATAGAMEQGDEKPSAPPWAVPGLIMEGSTNIWAGDAGANKSTLMRLTCQSLNYGVRGVIPVRGMERSIWVNAEESPAEHTRQLGNVNAALGIDRRSQMFTLHARGMRIQDIALRLEKAVREQEAKHIFVDSLSRLAGGGDLNTNATANLLVDSVTGLGCSVNWIGHTGHEHKDRLAGSKHFENAARVMVLIQSRISIGGFSPELSRGVRAKVYKANGAALVDPMYWSLEYHPQHGLRSAQMSDEGTWPTLTCGAVWEDARGASHSCRRKTWVGVLPTGEVRCSRHQPEESEE